MGFQSLETAIYGSAKNHRNINGNTCTYFMNFMKTAKCPACMLFHGKILSKFKSNTVLNITWIKLFYLYIMSRTHIGDTESVHLMTINFFPILYNKAAESSL